MSREPQAPTYFGKLMPADEQALAEITDELRRQFAALGPGRYFEGRFGRDQHGRITKRSVAIKPPEIFPVRIDG